MAGRKLSSLLLLAIAAIALAASPAGATHSAKDIVSIGPTGGNGAVDVFFDFASADGARAFFETPESLVAADTDLSYDLYERVGGTTSLISTGPAGGNAELDVFPAAASDDGLRVFFETDEPLVAGDTDVSFDVYERAGTTTTLVSTGPAGGNGAFESFFHTISADGTRVIFETDEGLVAGDNDGLPDVYQRSAGTTTLLSTGPAGGNGAFDAFFAGSSDDASVVFFETDEQLVAGDTDTSLDVYQRSGGTTTQVSTGGNGVFDAFFRGSSLDGSRVFFQTSESLSGADTDTSNDVYERSGGTTTLVSAPGNGAFAATFDGSSSNGARVFFHSREQLVAGDTDSSSDVYERSGGTTKLVSTGTPGNGAFDADFSQASADGTRVMLETRESLTAGDTDTTVDVYERSGGATTTLLSTGPGGGNGTFDATFVGMSLDGQRVFLETAESLVAGDTDAVSDVYERWAGITTHISIGPTGGNGALAAFFGASSDDGARVFFDTREALVSADTDTRRDVYVADVSGYPRPKGATPTRVPLVPAFRQCTTPNRTHGPPLAFPSCNAPVLESTQLTVGSPDANGQAANATGFLSFGVVVGAPGGADDSDVSFKLSFDDVRVQGSLADYTGQLQARPQIRITDRANGPATNEPATGSEVELPVTVPCTATGSTTMGSTCSITTTMDAVTPGAVPEGKRSIWALDQARVYDGGADGLASTAPNTLFARQGVFIP